MDRMELIVRDAASAQANKVNGKVTSSNGIGLRSPASDDDATSKPIVVVTEAGGGDDNVQKTESQNTKKDTATLKLDEPEKLPSRPNSAAKNWRKIQTVVSINKAFQTLQPKPERKVTRHMHGSKSAIPVLPLPLAVTLLICNCLVPGLGTMISGFTYCCVATTYDQPERSNMSNKLPWLITTNLLVGICQLFTVTFLLVGWAWSISWGITMVYLSLDRRSGIT